MNVHKLHLPNIYHLKCSSICLPLKLLAQGDGKIMNISVPPKTFLLYLHIPPFTPASSCCCALCHHKLVCIFKNCLQECPFPCLAYCIQRNYLDSSMLLFGCLIPPQPLPGPKQHFTGWECHKWVATHFYPLIVDKHGSVSSLGLLWEKP